jgi:uncharacterized protein (DUF608 family)
MAKKNGFSRRDFLATASAAGVVAASGNAFAANEPQAFRSSAGGVIPFSREELFQSKAARVFSGEQLSEIAFPLGGIGTGTVSLGGRGQLRDWEIFNRPGKNKILPFSFVALWARPEGGDSVVRVVEAALMPPFRGAGGYNRNSAEGLPRLKSAQFTSNYPFAEIAFEDDSLPVSITLEAFNPFVPLNVDDSSLPVAILRYRITSRSPKPVDVSLAFSLLNAVGYDGLANLDSTRHPGFGKNLNKLVRDKAGDTPVNGLDMTSAKYAADDIRYGSMALLTTAQDVTARTSWAHGEWWDPFQKWYDEFAVKGEMRDPGTHEPSADGESEYSTLAPRFRLSPGGSQTVTFVLAWYFPVRENNWNAEKEVKGKKLRNYYGTRFKSAWDVAMHTVSNLKKLEHQSRDFKDVFYSTQMPDYVLEAVSSQAAILRTNTCMLLEGKQFFAFEGCEDEVGCCPMNCTHVWNYEQTLAFLYPDLERSMRHTDFAYNMHPDGSMAFRTLLPLGVAQWDHSPAADGQMGCIMKLYREWQISGDDEFLKQHWPAAKQALEFAWTHWDADRDGLMEGEQHNTYDIEFYGPNSMMSLLYLGALRAGELMAQSMNDTKAAESYRAVREKGLKNIERLWNGNFYIQEVPPPDKIRPMEKYAKPDWYATTVPDGEIRYQVGKGCLSDQLLGAWFADVVGLDMGVPAERIRKALESIYRYNFQNGFYNFPNTQRIYAINEEKGLLLCSWPNGGQPKLPMVYSAEVWTGIEFQVAGHMIHHGMVEEGLAIVKAITDRYDGRRRNPWNEIECGSHYARALASWSILTALSGYEYSGKDKRLGFSPRINSKDFGSFFCSGTAWGSYRQKVSGRSQRAELDIHHGDLPLRSFTVANQTGATKLSVKTALNGQSGPQAKLNVSDKKISVDFGSGITLPSGGKLSLEFSPA